MAGYLWEMLERILMKLLSVDGSEIQRSPVNTWVIYHYYFTRSLDIPGGCLQISSINSISLSSFPIQNAIFLVT